MTFEQFIREYNLSSTSMGWYFDIETQMYRWNLRLERDRKFHQVSFSMGIRAVFPNGLYSAAWQPWESSGFQGHPPKPGKTPPLPEVLYCLQTDCQYAGGSFETMADEMGMNIDSRTDLATYTSCVISERGLRKFLGPVVFARFMECIEGDDNDDEDY